MKMSPFLIVFVVTALLKESYDFCLEVVTSWHVFQQLGWSGTVTGCVY